MRVGVIRSGQWECGCVCGYECMGVYEFVGPYAYMGRCIYSVE